MCFRTKGMPESTTIFSVETADQVLNQMNEFVYLRANVNHDADLSIEVDPRIRNAWCRFRKYTLELYDRPSGPLKAQNLNAINKSRGTVRYGTRDNAERLRHVEPARVALRNAAPSPPQFSDSLHRLEKEPRRPPDFLSGQAYEGRK